LPTRHSCKPRAFTRRGVHPHLHPLPEITCPNSTGRGATSRCQRAGQQSKRGPGVRSWATLECTEPNIPGPRSMIRMQNRFRIPCCLSATLHRSRGGASLVAFPSYVYRATSSGSRRPRQGESCITRLPTPLQRYRIATLRGKAWVLAQGPPNSQILEGWV